MSMGNDLEILPQTLAWVVDNSIPVLVFWILVLLAPELVAGLQYNVFTTTPVPALFICGFSDACKTGLEFCLPGEGGDGVCRRCSDFSGRCFQHSLHIPNCTQFCRELILKSTTTLPLAKETTTDWIFSSTSSRPSSETSSGVDRPLILVTVIASVCIVVAIGACALCQWQRLRARLPCFPPLRRRGRNQDIELAECVDPPMINEHLGNGSVDRPAVNGHPMNGDIGLGNGHIPGVPGASFNQGGDVRPNGQIHPFDGVHLGNDVRPEDVDLPDDGILFGNGDQPSVGGDHSDDGSHSIDGSQSDSGAQHDNGAHSNNRGYPDDGVSSSSGANFGDRHIQTERLMPGGRQCGYPVQESGQSRNYSNGGRHVLTEDPDQRNGANEADPMLGAYDTDGGRKRFGGRAVPNSSGLTAELRRQGDQYGHQRGLYQPLTGTGNGDHLQEDDNVHVRGELYCSSTTPYLLPNTRTGHL